LLLKFIAVQKSDLKFVAKIYCCSKKWLKICC